MSLSISLKRVFKYGVTNLWRNRWLSVTAITVMTITLLVLSSLLVFNQLAGLSAKNLRDKVDISIFFVDGVSVQKIYEVKSELEGHEEVFSVKYISSEEALESFKHQHANNPSILESLKEFETNPLPQSLVVKAKELTLYSVLYEKLQRSRFVPLFLKINYEDIRDLIAKLDQITSGIRSFGIGVTLVFGFIAALVLFNTLRLTIFSRREEIEIMRLVGASNWFIRGPFIVEGIVYGLLATIIASVVLLPILSSIEPQINSFFVLELGTATFFSSDFWILVLSELGVGITLGVASSLIATKKYLEV